MKFINNANNELRIASGNEHLLDVFTPNYYLELGSISYDVIEKLLSHKLVAVDDIVYYAIQNKGIGASKLPDEEIKRKLPYLFFENVNHKNKSLQLFLTYGLIVTKNEVKMEQFSPLILMPVNLYFQDDKFYLQLIAKPIENKVAINRLVKNPLVNLLNDRFEHHLDNMYALDKYCLSYHDRGYEVKLENYLTFAEIVRPPLVLNHDIFDLSNQAIYDLENTAYNPHGLELLNITQLNNRQRLALLRALSNNSFGISGYLATGKTTTLINIATSLAHQGKKILYVSNMDDTLMFVEKVITQKGLGHLISNLNTVVLENPSNTINLDFKLDEFDTKKALLDNYKKIKEYEKLLTMRVLNFRFIDALREKILQVPPKDDFIIDDLSNYYKFEFDEIVLCLKRLENLRIKLPDIQKSLFVNIPIVHTIKYPNQIITLLFQIRRLFIELNEKKKYLETNHGLKIIQNYARFKNVITDIQALALDKVPSCWRGDNLASFKQAILIFPNLKKEIYTLREYQLTLDWNYHHTNIDIDKNIKNIYADFFKEKDIESINKILKDNKSIYSQLLSNKEKTKTLDNLVVKIKNCLNWNFDNYDDLAVQELLKLSNFVDHNIIKAEWADIKHYKDTRREIHNTYAKISKFYEKENLYNQYFDKYKDKNSAIDYLEKIALSGKKPKKFKDANIINLLNEIKDYAKKSETIEELKKHYKLISGQDYLDDALPTENLDKCYNYFMSIQDLEIRDKFIKFFMTTSQDRLVEFINTLHNFTQILQANTNCYNYLLEYFPDFKAEAHFAKIAYINKCYQYILKLRETNSMMLAVVKESKNYVAIEEYLLLKKRIENLQEIKNSINNNVDYTRLFGHLYEVEDTKIGDVNTALRVFSNYLECFETINSLEESLDPAVHQEIFDTLTDASNIIYEITETFKLYCKIFKDGIGDYYYNDIDNVISYLDKLIDAKEELTTYLEITANLQILMKYKLFKLNKLIIENKITDLVNLFRYKYFNTLYQNYVQKNPKILLSEDILHALSEVMDLEEALTLIYAKKIQKPITKSSEVINTINYQDYVLKTLNVKSIYLTSTQILNQFLDIQNFDLVIIDDAHLLNANEYYKAVQGRQVIIAGEEQQQMTMAASLITRMHKNDVMHLNYRYQATPLELLQYANGLTGVFKANLSDNVGFSIVKEEKGHYIADLFSKNNNIIINFFTPLLLEQRNLYEVVTNEMLKKGFSKELIYHILRKNLNITDLYSGYIRDADYNMFCYRDYINDNNEIGPSITANLFLCKNKLIIFDEQEEITPKAYKQLLASFSRSFKVANNDVFSNNYDPLHQKIIDAFKIHGFVNVGSYKDITFILKNKKRYYGVILFANHSSSHIDILSDYRDYIINYQDNNFKIKILWLLDLAENFDEAIEKILKELQDE